MVTVGNYVTGGAANATVLTTIVSLDPIHCAFDASEQQLLKYMRLERAGQRESSRAVKNPVYMALADEAGFPHQGHMDFVGNRLDMATATIRGRAIFKNSDKLLVPGLFARVRVPGSAPHDAVLVPDPAIGSDQSQRFVMVVGADGTAARKVVELGPLHDGLRIVHAGLKGDERVVVEGLQFVRPGAKVMPEEIELKLKPEPNGLPETYQPVPQDQWLGGKPAPAPAPIDAQPGSEPGKR
jgi:multidrug efflux system membrane fusion protein